MERKEGEPNLNFNCKVGIKGGNNKGISMVPSTMY